MANENISNNYIQNKGDSEVKFQSSVDEKKKIIQDKVKEKYQPKIDMLTTGKERVQKYAESQKKTKIDSITKDYESKINAIEEKYKKAEMELDSSKENKIKEIINSIDSFSLSEDEKKKIEEALNISFENVIKEKKKAEMTKEKEREKELVEKEYEESKNKIEYDHLSFINKYDSIFDDRINRIKEEMNNRIKEIDSSVSEADVPITKFESESNSEVYEKTGNSENANVQNINEEVKRDTKGTNVNLIRKDLTKLFEIISISVLGTLSVIFVISREEAKRFDSLREKWVNFNKPISDSKVINKKNSTIYVDILPIEIESGDNVPVSTPTIKSNESTIPKSTSTKSEISTSTTSAKGVIRQKENSHESIESKQAKPPSKVSIKPKNGSNNEIIKKSNTGKEDLGSVVLEFKRSIRQLKEKAEELKYDGIPIAKGSSKSHILKFIKTIEEMDKNGKLSIEQKRKLSVLLREMAKSLDMYVKKEQVIITTIPDDIIEIKRDVVKYIKWLLSQNINPDAIEYVIKQWKKSIAPKHLKAVQ
ncbi:MAG: hypothetical protein QW054_01515 [Candidatus Micrarchaeia archaeon]